MATGTNAPSVNAPYLLLTGVVLIAVVFLFAVLQPMMDEANALRNSIAEDTQELKKKQDFLDTLNIKISQLDSQAAVEQQLATVLPEDDRDQDILRVLHEYAVQSGIVQRSVTNNTSRTQAQTNAARSRGEIVDIPQGVQTIAFQVTAEGTYEQMRAFVRLMEKSPRIANIPSIDLDQNPEQPENITANMLVQFYAQGRAE